MCIFICTKQRTTSLFLFVNKQLCYSRKNKNFSRPKEGRGGSSKIKCYSIIKRNKEVSLRLMQINIHTYILNIDIYLYIIYLFETIVSKAWPSSSVFFKIINIIFLGVSISWILKVFCFYLVAKPAF